MRSAAVVALLAAFGLGIWLRWQQAHASLDFDEFASIYFSREPLVHLWGPWMLRETNPPLFYTLLKGWRALVPDTAMALRALPLFVSLAQIALVARIAWTRLGPFAAALCVLLFALSPSDIFGSDYLRGYGLAKLAVTVAFAGLLGLREGKMPARRALALLVGGSLVAIYCHTTMLLWPVIATAALLVEAAASRTLTLSLLTRLAAANGLIALGSAWVIGVGVAQLGARSGNIGWIQPLPLADYATSLDLQLLLDSTSGSLAMAALLVLGAIRTWRRPVTRLSLLVAGLAVVVFKAADAIHPIVSDYTLHWAQSFTVLPACAALAEWRARSPAERAGSARAETLVALLVMANLATTALWEYDENVWIIAPQDWRLTVRTVATHPGAALLASHVSIGLVVTQACRLYLHAPRCPFPLVVLANRAPSDSWARDGYPGPLVPPSRARAALAGAREVYAFSRYVYTPLDQIGLDASRYRVTEWDDGELIGPIPIADISGHR